MRKIVKDVKYTKVQILESSDGKINELDTMMVIGEFDPERTRREMLKKYKGHNCFFGDVTTEEKHYEMSAADFIKYCEQMERETV